MKVTSASKAFLVRRPLRSTAFIKVGLFRISSTIFIAS